MGSESHEMIPCLDFSKDHMLVGSEEWKEMSKKVREALESYGCFSLMYHKIPEDLYEDFFMGLKELFDLPEETKRKFTNPASYLGYDSGSLENPRQSFGLGHVDGDNAQAFTNLMWPQQNHAFCETLKEYSSKMYELSLMIVKLIQEGYDLPKEYTSSIEELKSTYLFRVMKYLAPENGKENDKDSEVLGLGEHTDGCSFTILGQGHQVQGLQVLTKENKWIQLNFPKNGFVVVVGDILKAWSNGRIHAVTHRVVMNGDKDRYAMALFLAPRHHMKIEVPHELVDDKIHPLRYRSFIFGDYTKAIARPEANVSSNAVDVFAGI